MIEGSAAPGTMFTIRNNSREPEDMPMDEPQLLVTQKDICLMLDLSRPTVRKLIEAGELPRIKVGRSVRIPRAAVVAWIDAQVATAGEQNATLPNRSDAGLPRASNDTTYRAEQSGEEGGATISGPRAVEYLDRQEPGPNKYRQFVEAVALERMRQIIQWGGLAHDMQHDEMDWLSFLRKHAERVFGGIAHRAGLGLTMPATPSVEEVQRRLIVLAALCGAYYEVLEYRKGDIE